MDRHSHDGGHTGAPAGIFDYYLLRLFWSPVHCCQWKGYCNYQHVNTLLLHGLWPNYNNTSQHPEWPQYCRDASNHFDYGAACFPHHHDNYTDARCQLNRSVIDPDLRSALYQYAPGYVDHTMGDHEWIKHGSCTNLTELQYLRLAIETQLNVIDIGWLARHAGQNISGTVFQRVFPGSVVETSSDHSLQSISTCWSKDGEQINPCPGVSNNDTNWIVLPTAGKECYQPLAAAPEKYTRGKWLIVILLMLSGLALCLLRKSVDRFSPYSAL